MLFFKKFNFRHLVLDLITLVVESVNQYLLLWPSIPWHYITTNTITINFERGTQNVNNLGFECTKQTRCLSIKIYVYGIKYIQLPEIHILCSPAFITYIVEVDFEKRVPALHFQRRRDAIRECVFGNECVHSLFTYDKSFNITIVYVARTSSL